MKTFPNGNGRQKEAFPGTGAAAKEVGVKIPKYERQLLSRCPKVYPVGHPRTMGVNTPYRPERQSASSPRLIPRVTYRLSSNTTTTMITSSPTPPAGGTPANQVDVVWNWGDQSSFRYDPLSQSYLRFANRPGEELTFTPQPDRLNGRQLLYQNVIIMYVDYIKYAETMLDINLSIGQMGRADLFRNGQVYHIYWSTIAQQYEQETQRLRPIRFTDSQGNPFPLAPGHTWVHVFTPASGISEKVPGSGIWTALFMAP